MVVLIIVYNGCHDFLMLCFNISYITIITVKGTDYHCIIHDISKSDSSGFKGHLANFLIPSPKNEKIHPEKIPYILGNGTF